ncbi:hypothetical protein FRC17_000845 [Serendipita sp. 399]|nr:hypothetical protein FRC17_000845 [Serendipita sp. 399]
MAAIPSHKEEDGIYQLLYDFSVAPQELLNFELGPCTRSAKWCSDGQAILTSNEDRCLDVYTTNECVSHLSSSTLYTNTEPYARYSQSNDSTTTTDQPPLVLSKKSFRQGSPIYETAWYPYATPTNPSTYCFLASLRDSPIKLFDATDGRLRASYKIIDHRERFVAPHSLAFNLTAQKIYGGFLDAIEVFDVSVPGEGTRLSTTPSKKSRDGLRGIVSSLAFCPDYSGMFAAGTFSSSIGLLSEETGGEILMYLNDVKGPVSQLLFHPTNPRLLFARFRHQRGLYVWDVRNASTCYSRLVEPAIGTTLDHGSTSSNQRRYFDIESSGQWLVDGSQDGTVNVYKVDDILEAAETESVLSFPAHNDAISTATFCPTKPMILTISGSRRFDMEEIEVGKDEGVIELDESEEEESEPRSEDRSQPKEVPQSTSSTGGIGSGSRVTIGDSRMKLWRLHSTKPV